ncbi:4-hydroxy-tetrahydrodipicolinate reductase [Amaricoccus sp. W119]|uniref:4-hydroxy-tetrahydrodipicolinate reductase n=1 Tax=Amaricoccus sp. W119 TaxID=3391833 RepID=UPI0039A52414
MPSGVGIAVVGVAGRMGRMLVAAVREAPGAYLGGATVRPGHPWAGQDLGEAMGGAPMGVKVEDDPLETFARCQAVVDFTTPEATVAFSELAAQARLTHVVGTTGLDAADLGHLRAAGRHAVIVRAGNMSVGVNLLVELTRKIAEVLGPDYDIEVVEMHHRHKVDAPSGTALMLGEAAAEGRGVALDDARVSGRDGMTGARPEGAIGFASLRGGDVIGEHEVIFAGPGERVALRHVASDRMLFARGAVRAALWGQGRAPGEYTMRDVLGLAS